MGGLSHQLTEDELRNFFEKFGRVKKATLMYDRVTNQPRGFGFVVFMNVESAKAAIGSHEVNGRMAEAKMAEPPASGPQSYSSPTFFPGPGIYHQWATGGNPEYGLVTGRLFVGGLPITVTEEEFKAFFEKFGRVQESYLMYDKNTNRCRGFGFVVYEHAACAQVAVGHHQFGGRMIEAKFAEPRPSAMGGGRGGIREQAGQLHPMMYPPPLMDHWSMMMGASPGMMGGMQPAPKRLGNDYGGGAMRNQRNGPVQGAMGSKGP
eukprot:Filipodium_phascolosomae@DN1655_c0_g1_i1.p1